MDRWRRDAGWACLYIGLAVVLLAPLSLHPATRLPDEGDGPLVVWVVWWGATHLSRGYPGFFDANAFYPHPGGLLYGEPQIAQAVLAWPLFKLTDNPVLVVNVLLIATIALNAFACHLLARAFVGADGPAAVGAVLYAFNAYTLSNLPRLQIVSLQWMPFALLSLHRFFLERRTRHALAFAAFSVLHGLACFYYLLFFLVGLAVLIPAYIWETRAWRFPRALLALLAAGLGCGAILGAAALPYLRLYRHYGLSSELKPFDVVLYFLPPSGSLLYGSLGSSLRPGGYHLDYFLGYGALALGLLGSVWLFRRNPWNGKHRILAAYLVVGVLALLLSAGPRIAWSGHAVAPGPFALLGRFEPFARLREPRRFAILVALSLSLFVAQGAAILATWFRSARRSVTCGSLAVLLTLEHLVPARTQGVRIPTGGEVPEVYHWLALRPGSEPMADLPVRPRRFDRFATLDQYFSTRHGKPLLTGWPSFYPPALELLQWELREFPDSRSVTVLRALGIRLAVVHPKRWQERRDAFLKRLDKRGDSLPLVAAFPDRDHPFWARYGFGGERVYALAPLEEEGSPRPCHCREIERRSMRVGASTGEPELALDGNAESRWTTSVPQARGHYFEISFDRPRRPARIEIEMISAYGEFARGIEFIGYLGSEERPVRSLPDVWQTIALVRQLVHDPRRARLRYDLDPTTVERLRLVVGHDEAALPPWTVPEIHVYEVADERVPSD